MSSRPPTRADTCRRVLIIDADRRVRRDLAELLALTDGLAVAGTASDVGSALALLAAEDPDVVVVDPRLPDVEDGLALVADLRQRTAARIVVLSHDAALRPRALARGGDIFLTESDTPAAIIEAVRP